MKSSTRSLINALRVLDSEIQSEDGVANAVVAEAANRLEEQQERMNRLEDAGDSIVDWILYNRSHLEGFDVDSALIEWRQAKEDKP